LNPHGDFSPKDFKFVKHNNSGWSSFSPETRKANSHNALHDFVFISRKLTHHDKSQLTVTHLSQFFRQECRCPGHCNSLAGNALRDTRPRHENSDAQQLSCNSIKKTLSYLFSIPPGLIPIVHPGIAEMNTRIMLWIAVHYVAIKTRNLWRITTPCLLSENQKSGDIRMRITVGMGITFQDTCDCTHAHTYDKHENACSHE
jgi:hypothetical protein